MKPNGVGVCVVGDDAQAIYSFRAATVDNILEFPAALHAARADRQARAELSLGAADPRRSERVDERQRRGSIRSSCAPSEPVGGKPRYVAVQDDQAQALYVVEQVLAAREQGTLLRTQAVLVRSAHHTDMLELELLRRNIPYVKYGGLKFLEAAHVKDVLALLRWADNPRNRIAGFPRPAAAARRRAGDGRPLPESFRSERLRVADSCRVPHAGGGGSRMVVADGADGRPDERARVARSARPTAQVVRAAARTHLRRGQGSLRRHRTAGAPVAVSTRRASNS